MACVLIIDSDPGLLLDYKRALRAAGHEVATAALGEDGVAAAHRYQYEVVLCDQRLPDQSGTEVVSLIRKSCLSSKIVLLAASATPESIVAAKRAGATTYAAKPLTCDDVVAVVDNAVRVPPPLRHAAAPNLVGYAARRWADLIARGALLPDDPSTVLQWCRGVAVARSTLQHRCDAVNVRPKDSLDLVRLLRIVIHHAGEAWDLQSWLSTVDDRTARALMERAGLRSPSPYVPANVELFLSHQRRIARPDLIEALRVRLPVVSPRGTF